MKRNGIARGVLDLSNKKGITRRVWWTSRFERLINPKTAACLNLVNAH